MNKHYVQSLFDEHLRTCGVTFQGGKQVYTYKHRLDDLKEKDRVVVQTPDKGMQVCDVVRVDVTPDLDADSSIDYRWIVARIDTAAYDAEQVKDEAVFSRVKELQREHHRKSARAALLGSAPELAALMPGVQAPPATPTGFGSPPSWAPPQPPQAAPIDVSSVPMPPAAYTPPKPAFAVPAGWERYTDLQRQAYIAGAESAPRTPNPYNPNVQPDLYTAYQAGINDKL